MELRVALDGKGRVLILDDDPIVGRSIAQLCEYLDIESVAVTDPTEFFRFVTDWNPTHIILDLVMPEMDGVQVLQQLARQSCRARITISSGVGNRVLDAARRSAVEHGLDIAGVLPKPFSVTALKEVLFSDPYGFAPALVADRPNNVDVPELTKEDIQNAIAERQFRLAYQPIIHCETKLLKGFEALVRWDHPTKGLIMPDRFIPMSENLGMIRQITDQVIEMALKWIGSLVNSSNLTISINISAKTLGDLQFVDVLEEKCKQARVSSDVVILEVTETAAMDDQLPALDMFTRLRMKGFHVSIDDFGIGNSSLALLARLPFSEIKIDRSFAMTSISSAESRAIIKSTVDLSHSLELSVVTEGVEDIETLDFLRDIGCDLAQGYYIARPMAGDAVADWMAERSEYSRHNLL